MVEILNGKVIEKRLQALEQRAGSLSGQGEELATHIGHDVAKLEQRISRLEEVVRKLPEEIARQFQDKAF